MRMVSDVPVDGRRVLVRVRVRRMRCPVAGCRRQTFREQAPGVLDRYQRRTIRLIGQVSAIARELAGRAGEWLRDHPGVQVACRDGPGAIRGGPPVAARRGAWEASADGTEWKHDFGPTCIRVD
jgi:hypothetical protein